MRIALAAAYLAFSIAVVVAQAQPADKNTGDLPQGTGSPHSTGRTTSPETKGQQQPQGPTGPTETTTGGAPAEFRRDKLRRACSRHLMGRQKRSLTLKHPLSLLILTRQPRIPFRLPRISPNQVALARRSLAARFRVRQRTRRPASTKAPSFRLAHQKTSIRRRRSSRIEIRQMMLCPSPVTP